MLHLRLVKVVNIILWVPFTRLVIIVNPLAPSVCCVIQCLRATLRTVLAAPQSPLRLITQIPTGRLGVEGPPVFRCEDVDMSDIGVVVT